MCPGPVLLPAARPRPLALLVRIQAEFQSDDLMEQFKKLEYKGTADQQLLELKAKMGLLGGGGQDTRQLGAGAKPGAEPVHDAELLENPDKKS